jgi:hypothetical protein
MKNPTLRSRAFLSSLSAALLLLAASAVQADVTTETRMAVTGVGAMAFGNMTGTAKTAISGTRSRTDTDIQLQSKLVKFFARNAVGPSAEIVLLDADKQYRLNLNKKEYTETSFEELRARAQNAQNDNAGEDADKRRQPSAIDDSKCEWLDPKADVKRTGEKTTVAGFQAEHVVITAEQPCKDKETGAICEIALTIDEWLAAGFSANEEVQRYHKAYAQKMGLDAATLQDASNRAQAMFARYKGVWTQVLSKLQGVKGYPVRSAFVLGIGGDQCKQAQNAQQEQANGGDSSTGPGSSGASSGDAASQAIAKLGSLFHRKKDDSADQGADRSAQPASPPPPVAGPSGTINIVTISSELVSVSNASIPAAAFAVPPDFKKVEAKRRGET